MTSDSVGKETERMVVAWLRNNGFPGAERRVRTGYRCATRESPDEGDVLGTPSICWQIKSLRPANRAELEVPKWLTQTEAQRVASSASLGFLVVRRWGTANVSRWWAFQRLDQLRPLADAENGKASTLNGAGAAPVRMDMAALAGLLSETGWAGSAEETP